VIYSLVFTEKVVPHAVEKGSRNQRHLPQKQLEAASNAVTHFVLFRDKKDTFKHNIAALSSRHIDPTLHIAIGNIYQSVKVALIS
jgi:hypothetical protein